MIAREYMSPEPFVVHVTDSIGSVLTMMMEADVRHLPVVENGMLLGIVSDRDLRRSLDVIPGPARGGRLNALERPISDLMSSDVISVNEETEIVEVIDLMLDHKIGALPVVDGDSLKVVGIISYIDVLRAARPKLS
ncbi:MAG TPA: CBS domain-containing protein [Polyangiaceae bacterium]|nr:CBS domain-containing protein [Polyangiaceae bacterium]